jgi:hypothetical protein
MNSYPLVLAQAFPSGIESALLTYGPDLFLPQPGGDSDPGQKE